MHIRRVYIIIFTVFFLSVISIVGTFFFIWRRSSVSPVTNSVTQAKREELVTELNELKTSDLASSSSSIKDCEFRIYQSCFYLISHVDTANDSKVAISLNNQNDSLNEGTVRALLAGTQDYHDILMSYSIGPDDMKEFDRKEIYLEEIMQQGYSHGVNPLILFLTMREDSQKDGSTFFNSHDWLKWSDTNNTIVVAKSLQRYFILYLPQSTPPVDLNEEDQLVYGSVSKLDISSADKAILHYFLINLNKDLWEKFKKDWKKYKIPTGTFLVNIEKRTSFLDFTIYKNDIYNHETRNYIAYCDKRGQQTPVFCTPSGQTFSCVGIESLTTNLLCQRKYYLYPDNNGVFYGAF